ncbi:centaurin-gamma-1A-like [Choristoneura fumiferana]|uniref:centaurin-gamma-1A-like n=1 Tax=Choristoneura fumiferana TaxID=7141 RepID=UPI003D159FBA
MLSSKGVMCNRQHTQACLNTSLSIRQEIQRFESVHPSIYALYDLVELVPDPLLAQQIRDHVVAIEATRNEYLLRKWNYSNAR